MRLRDRGFLMAYLLLAGGLVALLVGGDLLVRGAVGVAQRLKVPPLVIGLTLVGFGTSAPELATSLQAALGGAPGIAAGNVVGSNVANVLLILGLAALIRPIAVDGLAFRRDGSALVLATLLGIALMLTGALERWHGTVLVAGLAAFLLATLRRPGPVAATEAHDVVETVGRRPPLWRAGLFFALGLALVLGGARALVTGGVEIAAALGVSEAVIGLTIVAVGTSLPELVTSVVAAWRGEGDVAFGNVVGSNIFNLLGILGVTALVTPLPIDARLLQVDVWAMAAATALLVAAAVTGWRVTRAEAAALLALYAGYLVLTVAL
jgi:cation:H+ antiporter